MLWSLTRKQHATGLFRVCLQEGRPPFQLSREFGKWIYKDDRAAEMKGARETSKATRVVGNVQAVVGSVGGELLFCGWVGYRFFSEPSITKNTLVIVFSMSILKVRVAMLVAGQIASRWGVFLKAYPPCAVGGTLASPTVGALSH